MKQVNVFSCRTAWTGIVGGLAIVVMMLSATTVGAQCQPYIKIDGNRILANQTIPAGLQLPMWLREGQTLEASSMVNSISVIEFTINGSALEFSQVLNVTSVQTVPSGKAWKIEAVSKQPALNESFGATYTSAGTYTFTVPACAESICVEVWGAGGNAVQGNAGGGGGYGQGCYSVTPGSTHTVTVAAGGSGSASSVGSLISATSGASGSAGGAGGTSSAPVNIQGGNASSTRGGSAGCGLNCEGGQGGLSVTTVICGGSSIKGGDGTAPGGGGGRGSYDGCYGSYGTPGNGADGKVVITW